MAEQVRKKPFFLWRHLNKLRWASLTTVFLMLIALPYIHVYQTFVAAHAYDFLAPSEKQLYDVVEFFTAPLTDDPADRARARADSRRRQDGPCRRRREPVPFL